MAKEVVVKADKVKGWQKFGKRLRTTLLILLAILILIYIVLRVTFDEGNFVVTLSSNDSLESGLAMFESLYDRTGKRTLKAESIQFMDNITEKWLPDDIDGEYEGSHNGDNYIAYTFYIENQSSDTFNYWYSLKVEDVIKDVDEAVRIKIYLNGEPTVYAKGNSIDGGAEEGTVKFRDDKDGTIVLEQRVGLKSKEIDRITVVVWIEGSDPECVDALIGGEISMKMDITEEHTHLNENKNGE